MSTEQLLEDWLKAKSVEESAKKARIEAEKAIIGAIGLHNHEGSKTHNIGEYKVTLKTAMNRKLDIEGAAAVLAGISEDLRPVKVVADETCIKYLSDNEPEIYKVLSPWVEVKPAKVSVTVLRKE